MVYNYDSIDDLTKLILRSKDHPSKLAIKNKCTELNSTFIFKRLIRTKYLLQLND